MTTVCSRGCCKGRITYIRALCVDHDSADFGKSIKIEIPDGYVMLPTFGRKMQPSGHRLLGL